MMLKINVKYADILLNFNLKSLLKQKKITLAMISNHGSYKVSLFDKSRDNIIEKTKTNLKS